MLFIEASHLILQRPYGVAIPPPTGGDTGPEGVKQFGQAGTASNHGSEHLNLNGVTSRIAYILAQSNLISHSTQSKEQRPQTTQSDSLRYNVTPRAHSSSLFPSPKLRRAINKKLSIGRHELAHLHPTFSCDAVRYFPLLACIQEWARLGCKLSSIKLPYALHKQMSGWRSLRN